LYSQDNLGFNLQQFIHRSTPQTQGNIAMLLSMDLKLVTRAANQLFATKKNEKIKDKTIVFPPRICQGREAGELRDHLHSLLNKGWCQQEPYLQTYPTEL